MCQWTHLLYLQNYFFMNKQVSVVQHGVQNCYVYKIIFMLLLFGVDLLGVMRHDCVWLLYVSNWLFCIMVSAADKLEADLLREKNTIISDKFKRIGLFDRFPLPYAFTQWKTCCKRWPNSPETPISASLSPLLAAMCGC